MDEKIKKHIKNSKENKILNLKENVLNDVKN